MFKSTNLRTGVPVPPWREQAHSDRGDEHQEKVSSPGVRKAALRLGGNGPLWRVSKLNPTIGQRE